MAAESLRQRPRSTYIEYLEKRIAPATFVVTNLNDAGAGSLRFAVERANAAPGADTIVFKGVATSGEITLTSGEIDITDSVNIQGPGVGKLIIDAQNLSRIFNIDDNTAVVKKVTISGLSMVDGNSGIEAGGGLLSRESLTLVNSVVSGSHGESGGGIGVFTVGKLIIRNSKITGNTAGSNGGGVDATAEGGIQVINSVISGNTTEASRGGGIYARIGITAGINATGNILIANSTITQNIAATAGGGIEVINNRLNGATTVQNTLISGNVAESGGVEFRGGGRMLIDRCVISNNIGTSYGGGLTILSPGSGDSLTIKNSQIINNHADATTPYGGGGGIHVQSFNRVLPVTIQGSLISGNSSATDGGGILVIGSRLTLQNSTISGNSSGDDGGGIYATVGSVAITKSTIRDNSATDLGGGLAGFGPSGGPLDLRITGSTFSANRAGYSGGAVHVSGYDSVAISSSKFLQNSAGGSGGGVYVTSAQGSISITGSTIGQNRALYSGGGVFVYGAPTVPVTIVTTTISNNMAGVLGGGVLFVNGLESFRASTITGNVAGIAGGGIANYSGAPLTLNGTIVTGNTAPTFPQIAGPLL